LQQERHYYPAWEKIMYDRDLWYCKLASFLIFCLRAAAAGFAGWRVIIKLPVANLATKKSSLLVLRNNLNFEIFLNLQAVHVTFISIETNLYDPKSIYDDTTA